MSIVTDKKSCCEGGGYPFCTGEKQQPHPCPYMEDINDDSETLCECCKICEGECAADI